MNVYAFPARIVSNQNQFIEKILMQNIRSSYVITLLKKPVLLIADPADNSERIVCRTTLSGRFKHLARSKN